MRLDIVTPEKKAFSDEIDSVVVPGAEGEMGILKSHAPLVTTLQPGELRYMKNGVETSLAIGTGINEGNLDQVLKFDPKIVLIGRGIYAVDGAYQTSPERLIEVADRIRAKLNAIA